MHLGWRSIPALRRQEEEAETASERSPEGSSLTLPLKTWNRRNGTSPKTIQSESGMLPIDDPRDRNGTFEPLLIGKHQRRLPGFDEKILALSATGLTTRDILDLKNRGVNDIFIVCVDGLSLRVSVFPNHELLVPRSIDGHHFWMIGTEFVFVEPRRREARPSRRSSVAVDCRIPRPARRSSAIESWIVPVTSPHRPANRSRQSLAPSSAGPTALSLRGNPFRRRFPAHNRSRNRPNRQSADWLASCGNHLRSCDCRLLPKRSGR